MAETVNYIIQRGDLYSTMLMVASLALYALRPDLRQIRNLSAPSGARAHHQATGRDLSRDPVRLHSAFRKGRPPARGLGGVSAFTRRRRRDAMAANAHDARHLCARHHLRPRLHRDAAMGGAALFPDVLRAGRAHRRYRPDGLHHDLLVPKASPVCCSSRRWCGPSGEPRGGRNGVRSPSDSPGSCWR